MVDPAISSKLLLHTPTPIRLLLNLFQVASIIFIYKFPTWERLQELIAANSKYPPHHGPKARHKGSCHASCRIKRLADGADDGFISPDNAAP